VSSAQKTLIIADTTWHRGDGEVQARYTALWTMEAGGPRFDWTLADQQRRQAKYDKQREQHEASEKSRLCCLLRDIFGILLFHRLAIASSVLAWDDRCVVNLATGIYMDRAFYRVPILADAFEEAGCTDADILSHCRLPGEHVRGCWVVDLCLCKM
jgi:hypothetical protein